MNKKYVSWLYNELPRLVEQGVLTEAIAEQVRRHYGPVEKKSRLTLLLTIFSCLGAALIGLGIILLLAHNWEDLSRSVRTVLSLLPLIVAQVLAGWVLFKRMDSTAWREGSAVFLMLGIGIAISLISQTYHLSGSVSRFLLSWMLLTVPVIYLLDASVPVVFYWIGCLFWVGFSQMETWPVGVQAQGFWLWTILMIPHYWKALREDRYSNRSLQLSWAFGLCLGIGTGIVFGKDFTNLWIISYSSLFGVMYLIGVTWFGEAPLFRRPFQTLGSAGIVVVSLLLTYKFAWTVGGHLFSIHNNIYMEATIYNYLTTAVLLVAAIILWIEGFQQGSLESRLFGASPILALLGYAIYQENPLYPMILFDIYLLALGIGVTLSGIRQGELSTVNTGTLILSLLLITRFFDNEMGFVARGIVFILIGILFLVTNGLMVRWLRTQKGEEK